MTKDIKKILAKNIKRLRKQKRLTQENLSLELELDGSYIGKIENAKMNIARLRARMQFSDMVFLLLIFLCRSFFYAFTGNGVMILKGTNYII